MYRFIPFSSIATLYNWDCNVVIFSSLVVGELSLFLSCFAVAGANRIVLGPVFMCPVWDHLRFLAVVLTGCVFWVFTLCFVIEWLTEWVLM